MLSKIRSDVAVRKFWTDAIDRLSALEEELAEVAGDFEMELDDESAAGKDTVEFKELAKLFKRVDVAYGSVENAIKVANRNHARVTGKS